MEESPAFSFRASVDELDRFREIISGFIEKSLDEIEKNRVILALDEAFVNIAEHGYGPEKKGEIELSMRRSGEGLEFVLLDRAPEFDPTAAGNVNLEQHGEKGESTGLGIHLFTTLMKTTYSTRPGGGNRLVLFKAV